jgi:DNA polymerase-3 subunit gamma/tau
MGLPRVVRCLEYFGRALVDMRDAPDPQVVLEIALVRSARPDLDPDIDALVQRVEALERGLSSATLPTRIPEPTAAVAPPPEPVPAPTEGTRRPSLGAVRRRQQAANGDAPAATPATPEALEPEAAPAPLAATPPPAVTATAVDRDSLTQAWGDGILGSLPARVKAAFSAGWFVSASDEGARFALPNSAHRDHCAPLVPKVEQALAAHFGTPVRLILEVRDAGGAPSSAPASSSPPRSDATTSMAPDDDAVDHMDLMAKADGPDNQESEAEARLLQAFPGTTEVKG